MKTVYCIIVTFNGLQWIGRCLESLKNSTYPCRLLVIDNASTDSTVSFINNKFPGIPVVESGINAGFGQANNTGLKIALEHHADYVFLLNQDAWVEPGTLGALINIQLANPGFGIVSPLHFNGPGTALDIYFGRYLMNSKEGDSVVRDPAGAMVSPLLLKTNFVNAAAWLISNECLRKTGGFDPIFFHYGEDRNYTQRAEHKGFHIGIYTGTKIFHDREDRILKSAADQKPSLKKDYIEYLNYVCDLRQKHFPKIIFKRTLRHGFSALSDLLQLNRDQFHYHYSMALKIASSAFKVKKSRAIAAADHAVPHL